MRQQKRLINYLSENKKSRRQILDQMAQSKKEDFEKSVDNEVKKGIEENEQSDMYQSDDDSLMHEINQIGDNSP